jgi:hypothetical protein
MFSLEIGNKLPYGLTRQMQQYLGFKIKWREQAPFSVPAFNPYM